jgi:hypothetical protein
MTNLGALQTTMAWAEDSALLRSNLSADPGAKTGARAEHMFGSVLPRRSLGGSGIGTEAANLRGTMPRHPGQNAAQDSVTPIGTNSISR